MPTGCTRTRQFHCSIAASASSPAPGSFGSPGPITAGSTMCAGICLTTSIAADRRSTLNTAPTRSRRHLERRIMTKKQPDLHAVDDGDDRQQGAPTSEELDADEA